MNFKKVLISELKPAAYNPRRNLSEKDPEYQRIKKSIETFGYVDPVIVNSDYTVIGGHQRLKVLKDLGHAQIDVVLLDIPKTQEKALNVALNKITGEWDFQQLSIVLSELKEEEFDISIAGFSDEELKKIDEELFGEKINLAGEAHAKLADKFIVPPFSVLDTRQGYWQERKAAWIALGIKSELGRGGIDPAYKASNSGMGSMIF